MSEDLLHQALEGAVEEVLERMFFTETLGDALELEQSPAPPREDEIAVRVAFEGTPSGALTLRLTAAAARPIAADFLGEDQDAVSDGQIHEVACELANMICGSVLSRVESAATFRLAKPQIVSGAETAEAEPAAAIHAVEISNGNLTVMMTTERPACSPPAESAS